MLVLYYGLSSDFNLIINVAPLATIRNSNLRYTKSPQAMPRLYAIFGATLAEKAKQSAKTVGIFRKAIDTAFVLKNGSTTTVADDTWCTRL